MPSPAESIRSRLELGARVAAIVTVAWLAWGASRAQVEERAERGDAAEAATLLRRWSTDPSVTAAHLVASRAPSPEERAWLRGLGDAGVAVSWSGEVQPLAVSATPLRDPLRGSILAVVGLGDERTGVADAAGPVDSLDGASGAATLTLRGVAPPFSVTAGGTVATSVPSGDPVLRPVLVLGRPSWETRFAVTALEERGWRVVARIPIAPGVEVTQGSIQPIDTARYSAVVVLDSTARDLAVQVARYVRSGGGLVLGGDAARTAGLAALAPGEIGARVAAPIAIDARSARLDLLSFHSVARLVPGAAVLRTDQGATAAAVRRVESGRVAHTGYDESWRLRMAGGDDGISAHGDWWGRLVALVAYAPTAMRAGANAIVADPAPRALLYDALGPPGAEAVGGLPPRDWRRPELLLLLIGLILGEVVSRRWRGAA